LIRKRKVDSTNELPEQTNPELRRAGLSKFRPYFFQWGAFGENSSPKRCCEVLEISLPNINGAFIDMT
jgi:hypothetical protein